MYKTDTNNGKKNIANFLANAPKMSPTIHNNPEWKQIRKTFQGINATTKGSIEKSKRRHDSKQKALNKFK